METQAKKLIINGRFLTQSTGGVQNYARGIIKALRNEGISIEIVVPKGNHHTTDFHVKPIGLFRGFIWEQIVLPLYVRKRENYLLLNLCNSAPLLIKNKVVTIHDLAFEEKNNWFSPSFKRWYKFLIPRICKKSKLIITVSEFSKRKIREKYGIAESKIVVAPPGISEFTLDSDVPDYGNYVLLTGINNPRKNAQFVFNNLELLKQRGLKVVALGGNNSHFKKESLPKNEFIIYLNSTSFTEYYSLLKNARALIYPSFYEGFGIPVLESICLGTPVIVSDIEVFREVFGEIPHYFELGNKDSLAQAIDSLKDKKLPDKDITNLKNKFTFESSAKRILNALNNIM